MTSQLVHLHQASDSHVASRQASSPRPASRPASRPAPLRTTAFVLRRTNYGESDRILNLLTPDGRQSVIAKGVRKEKSRLAGGIELFCLSDVVIHRGKADLGTLTSARMLKYYANITAELPALEFAARVLKVLDRASRQVTAPLYFDLLQQVLTGLDSGLSQELVAAWFGLNFACASGEEPNFYNDATNTPLRPDCTYAWDDYAAALRPDPAGTIGADEIKFLRLMVTSPLELVARVKGSGRLLARISTIIATYIV